MSSFHAAIIEIDELLLKLLAVEAQAIHDRNSDGHNNDDDSKQDVYAVGDVIRVKFDRIERIAFAYIHIIDVERKLLDVFTKEIIGAPNDPLLDFGVSDTPSIRPISYGVEFFNFRPIEKYNDIDGLEQCFDGYIEGKKIFDVINPGYSAFITASQIHGSVWNERRSVEAIKNCSSYDHKLFVTAAKYGDLKLISHIISLPDYPQNPALCHYTYSDISGRKCKVYTKMSAFYSAVFYNHSDIVELFVSMNNIQIDINLNLIDVYNTSPVMPIFRRVLNCDVQRCVNNKSYNNVRFFNPDLLDKLCRDSNITMLEILFAYDFWPIYTSHSYALYNSICSGDLEIVQLLLSYIRNPHFINTRLPFNNDSSLLIPETNLNVLNCAVLHKNLNILKYVLIDWEFAQCVSMNRVIYYDDKPHTLPLVVYTLLTAKLNDLCNFTIPFMNFLCYSFDPGTLGLNWYCKRTLNEQTDEIFGTIKDNKNVLFDELYNISPEVFGENVLWINQSFVAGSLFSILMYKSERLWNTWQNNHRRDEILKNYIRELVYTFVKGGMDWNQLFMKNGHNVKVLNKFLLYNNYFQNRKWNVVNLDKETCKHEDFIIFIKDTVSEFIRSYRSTRTKVFSEFYSNEYSDLDPKLVNVFSNDILDYVIEREIVVDHIPYFN